MSESWISAGFLSQRSEVRGQGCYTDHTSFWNQRCRPLLDVRKDAALRHCSTHSADLEVPPSMLSVGEQVLGTITAHILHLHLCVSGIKVADQPMFASEKRYDLK